MSNGEFVFLVFVDSNLLMSFDAPFIPRAENKKGSLNFDTAGEFNSANFFPALLSQITALAF